MYFVPMSEEQKEYVRHALTVTTPKGDCFVDRVKDLISTQVEKDRFKISIVPARSNGFHGIDCIYNRLECAPFGGVILSSCTNHFGDETTCSFTLRSIKEIQTLRMALEHAEELCIAKYKEAEEKGELSFWMKPFDTTCINDESNKTPDWIGSYDDSDNTTE
jgi:hypothetical protein